MSRFLLLPGDCLASMRCLPDNSVDSIVTDPPYGLSFMGKAWDYDVPTVAVWSECFRVLKPGGHLLAFAGTRTQHRMACRIEDAGFEVRDMIAWVYGSGFPKSMDVSKAIDKAEGVDHLREFKCKNPADRPYTHETGETSTGWQSPVRPNKTHPYSDAARQWQGWGTALKPALEPITVARKPLVGTVAANVLAHGTGALNIDGCRVSGEAIKTGAGSGVLGGIYGWSETEREGGEWIGNDLGRWPANLIHDGSEEVVALFPHTKSGSITAGSPAGRDMRAGDVDRNRASGRPPQPKDIAGSEGSAARFFYCAKTSKADRGEGNTHPTVKPTDLMAYLCRLVTPPGGLVLDPFMGSGSTGKGALREGFTFIGCELSPEYVEIARSRLIKEV